MSLENAPVGQPSRKNADVACDPCRLLKVKCRKDAPNDTVCVKCKRSDANCTWPMPRSRTRRQVPDPTARIKALESKIDQLRDVLEEQQVASRSSASDGASNEDGSLLDRLNKRFRLTEEMAEYYLRRFRNMTLYFPFIIIPDSMDVVTLAQEKPTTCLAALAVSTARDHTLQSGLEEMLREQIIQQGMTQCRKSLDLLGALMVYLGWYHFYYVPKINSMSRFIWLAVGLCEDLGLGLTPGEAANRQIRHQTEHGYTKEALRLYLGTYFSITEYTWGFAEPTRFTDTDHVLMCADKLAQENDYATDSLILALVRMQVVAEQRHRLLADIDMFESFGPLQLDAQLDDVESTLLSIKNSLPPVLRVSTIADFAYHYALMYAYEADMVNPVKRRQRSSSQVYGATSNLLLKRCVNAIKGCFDTFFTIPACEYPFMSGNQWFSMTYAIVLLFKLSLGLPWAPLWDVQYARRTAPFEEYMEQCCKAMAFARRTAGDPPTAGRKDLYTVQENIWMDTLSEYRRKRDLPEQQRLTSSAPIVHRKALQDGESDTESNVAYSQNEHSPSPNTTKGARHPCPAYQYWK